MTTLIAKSASCLDGGADDIFTANQKEKATTCIVNYLSRIIASMLYTIQLERLQNENVEVLLLFS